MARRILVINAPGLHLGFLGCYGNDWVATPNLDRLAAEGVVFDQHHVTRPSYDTVANGGLTLPPGVEWINMPSLLPPWNLPADLLAVYGEDEDHPVEPWPNPPIGLIAADNIAELERLHVAYAAAVTYWDARLGDMLAPLRQSGELDRLFICVTASAGLPLGEHGQIGPYRPWLYEEIVHVPLVLRLPAGREAGLRIGALTEPADLLPTFAEFLTESRQVESAPEGGISLWPLVRGEIALLRSYVCSTWQIGPARERSTCTLDWTMIVPVAPFPGEPVRSRQLFAKPEDRWEVNDVLQHHLDLAEELERQIRD